MSSYSARTSSLEPLSLELLRFLNFALSGAGDGSGRRSVSLFLEGRATGFLKKLPSM